MFNKSKYAKTYAPAIMVQRSALRKALGSFLRALQFQIWEFQEYSNEQGLRETMAIYGNGQFKVTIRETLPR